MTPYRIAFIDADSLAWVIVDVCVDVIFALDVAVNFISTYYDSDDNLVTDRKKIASKYLRGWFVIDTVSILPLSHILSIGKDYASLARLARLPRLYRLIKIAK